MSIQIDRNLFKERVAHSFGKREYGDKIPEFSEEVYNLAQEWLDKEEWKTNHDLDTPREFRIEMKEYIQGKINLDDEDGKWFIPSYLWTWLAGQVEVFIVRLIIEYYWVDILQELPAES
jgi:hypothetical protein